MKSAILFIAAVAYGSQTIFAHSSELELGMTMKSVFDDLGPGHSLRLVDDNTISQQCIEEMTELNSNSDLMAASNRLNSCPTSERGNSATIDYNQCSTAVGAFQLACTSAGGKDALSVSIIEMQCRPLFPFARALLTLRMYPNTYFTQESIPPPLSQSGALTPGSRSLFPPSMHRNVLVNRATLVWEMQGR